MVNTLSEIFGICREGDNRVRHFFGAFLESDEGKPDLEVRLEGAYFGMLMRLKPLLEADYKSFREDIYTDDYRDEDTAKLREADKAENKAVAADRLGNWGIVATLIDSAIQGSPTPRLAGLFKSTIYKTLTSLSRQTGLATDKNIENTKEGAKTAAYEKLFGMGNIEPGTGGKATEDSARRAYTTLIENLTKAVEHLEKKGDESQVNSGVGELLDKANSNSGKIIDALTNGLEYNGELIAPGFLQLVAKFNPNIHLGNFDKGGHAATGGEMNRLFETYINNAVSSPSVDAARSKEEIDSGNNLSIRASVELRGDGNEYAVRLMGLIMGRNLKLVGAKAMTEDKVLGILKRKASPEEWEMFIAIYNTIQKLADSGFRKGMLRMYNPVLLGNAGIRIVPVEGTGGLLARLTADDFGKAWKTYLADKRLKTVDGDPSLEDSDYVLVTKGISRDAAVRARFGDESRAGGEFSETVYRVPSAVAKLVFNVTNRKWAVLEPLGDREAELEDPEKGVTHVPSEDSQIYALIDDEYVPIEGKDIARFPNSAKFRKTMDNTGATVYEPIPTGEGSLMGDVFGAAKDVDDEGDSAFAEMQGMTERFDAKETKVLEIMRDAIEGMVFTLANPMLQTSNRAFKGNLLDAGDDRSLTVRSQGARASESALRDAVGDITNPATREKLEKFIYDYTSHFIYKEIAQDLMQNVRKNIKRAEGWVKPGREDEFGERLLNASETIITQLALLQELDAKRSDYLSAAKRAIEDPAIRAYAMVFLKYFISREAVDRVDGDEGFVQPVPNSRGGLTLGGFQHHSEYLGQDLLAKKYAEYRAVLDKIKVREKKEGALKKGDPDLQRLGILSSKMQAHVAKIGDVTLGDETAKYAGEISAWVSRFNTLIDKVADTRTRNEIIAMKNDHEGVKESAHALFKKLDLGDLDFPKELVGLTMDETEEELSDLAEDSTAAVTESVSANGLMKLFMGG